jgi:hypothetical protein
MPNTLDGTGIQVKSLSEILDSNTPDGQLMNIFAQAISDIYEMIGSVYNSFSLDTAVGTQLDRLVALNGITRQVHSKTVITGAVTFDGSEVGLILQGLDETSSPFTIQDAFGNVYQLLNTFLVSPDGSFTIEYIEFQCTTIGPVNPPLSTAFTIVTPVAHVMGFTYAPGFNCSIVVGVDDETDEQLRYRHAMSLYPMSSFVADTIVGKIANLPYVKDVVGINNNTASSLSPAIGYVDGVNYGTLTNLCPPHALWLIIDAPDSIGGTSVETLINQVLFETMPPGIAMGGYGRNTAPFDQTVFFSSAWSNPVYANLQIKFQMNTIVPGLTFDHTLIASQLAAALNYHSGQTATIGDVITAMQKIEPRAYLTNVAVGYMQATMPVTNWADHIASPSVLGRFIPGAAYITIT